MEHMLWIGHKSCHCSFSQARQLRSYWLTGGRQGGVRCWGESCSLSRLSPTPPNTSSQFMKPTTHRNELHSMPPPCSMCRGRARAYAQDTMDHSRCMYICFSLASKLSILGGETDDTLSLCSGFLFLRWLSACTYACIHTCAAANCEEAFCEFM